MFEKFIRATVAGILNWKTTILGSLGLIAAILKNFDILRGGNIPEIYDTMSPYVGQFLVCLYAKDANFTGIAGEKAKE